MTRYNSDVTYQSPEQQHILQILILVALFVSLIAGKAVQDVAVLFVLLTLSVFLSWTKQSKKGSKDKM